MDQDFELGKGLDWWSVGGGGRHLRVRDGKSRDRGSKSNIDTPSMRCLKKLLVSCSCKSCEVHLLCCSYCSKEFSKSQFRSSCIVQRLHHLFFLLKCRLCQHMLAH